MLCIVLDLVIYEQHFLRHCLKIFVFVEDVLISECMFSHHAMKCCVPGMQKSLFNFTLYR